MKGNWEPCPRCESNRVRELGKLAMFLILMGSGSCLIWVGFLFPPLWIASGLLILASPIAIFIKPFNQCKDCDYVWQAGKGKEQKKALDDIEEAKKNKQS